MSNADVVRQVAEVKAYWDGRARDASLEQDLVTHRDRFQRQLEIDILLQYLPRGQRVLDVGCGNGFSTAKLAPLCAHVIGIDYSAPMIERARKEFGRLTNVEFRVQDVLQPELPPDSFDVAITQRCLINLTSWEAQRQALANIAGLLKPGGCLILQEGTKQGRTRLNEARAALGLPRMPPVSYNLDFDEEQLWPFLRGYFDIVDVRRLGLYDLIARVVHPLLVAPAEPEYSARINEVAWHVCAQLRGADELAREFSALLRRHG